MPTLSEIRVYPVKSLDPESVESVRLTEDGAPAPDRRYAIFDAEGEYVNGKNDRQIHRIRSEFDLDASRLRLCTTEQEEWTGFDPDEDRAALESWLGEYFEYDVTVRQNDEQGYPDDTNATGPTLISTGTLQAMASWFDGEGEWPDLGEAELRRRFRPNLVVDAPAFWEDRLYADRESTVSFSVGDVTLDGVNPCQRCVVPTRDSRTGDPDSGFRERFIERRRATLPEWVARDWYDHFYRVMVNTRVPAPPATLSVGDRVELGRDTTVDTI